MTSTSSSLNLIQKKIWTGHIPLHVVLSPSESRTYDKTDPYLISIPRLSYLPFLLRRLHAFFTPYFIDTSTESHHGWFSYDGVPLKWHIPIGLLYDLYAPSTENPQAQAQPFRLTVHFTDFPSDQLVGLDENGEVLQDAFMNSVKEADFVRSGTAKKIMSLSKEDSTGLWQAVMDHNLPTYTRISTHLLPPANQRFRNIPLRLYLPSSPQTADSQSEDKNPKPNSPSPEEGPATKSSAPPPTSSSSSDAPSLKIVQSPIPPTIVSSSGRSKPQTLGTALHTLLPGLFPSRSRTVLAVPILHGAVLPMGAVLEDVARFGGYGDGWVGVVIRMQ